MSGWYGTFAGFYRRWASQPHGSARCYGNPDTRRVALGSAGRPPVVPEEMCRLAWGSGGIVTLVEHWAPTLDRNAGRAAFQTGTPA